ncbi:124_t:CDS:2, partial [Cetraspora pellucida]
IKVMQLTMSHSKDSIVKKDARHLKQIMLTSEEWQLIKNLVKILQPFTNATKMLEFQEEIDLIDESEVLNTEFKTKINQTKINIPQVSLLVTLLDPRNKKMKFVTYSQRLEAKAYLVAEH